MDPKPVKVRVRRTLVDARAPLKSAHQFVYTRVGVDIVLEVGYFDLVEMKEVVDKAMGVVSENPELTFYVTDRFSLSPQGAVALFDSARQLIDDLKKNDLLPPGSKPASED